MTDTMLPPASTTIRVTAKTHKMLMDEAKKMSVVLDRPVSASEMLKLLLEQYAAAVK